MYISGILSMISCICLAIFSILSVIQLAMITSRDTVVLKYKTCIILKLCLAIITGKFNILKQYIRIGRESKPNKVVNCVVTQNLRIRQTHGVAQIAFCEMFQCYSCYFCSQFCVNRWVYRFHSMDS